MSGNKELLEQALRALKEGQQGSPRRADAVVAKALEISESRARTLVDELRDRGLVQRGRGKSVPYTIITNLTPPKRKATARKRRAGRTVKQPSSREVRTEVTKRLLREPVGKKRRELPLAHLAKALKVDADLICAAVHEVKANKVLGTRTTKGELVVWLA